MIRRAWHFITRKYTKSILMLLILFAISTLLISGITIRKAVLEARESVDDSIGASFTLRDNIQYSMGTARGTGTVPMSLIEQVKKISGVTDTALRMNCLTRLDNAVLFDNPKNPGAMYMPLEENYKNALAFYGVNQSEQDTLFRLETIRLSQGRHLQENDCFKSLVHEEFAKLNGLQIGDALVFSPFEDDMDNHNPAKQPIHTEIVGFFTGENLAEVAYANELYENIILTDLETTCALYGVTADTAIYDNATFFATDEKSMKRIMDEALTIDADWRTYQLVSDAQRYQTLQNSAGMLGSTVNGLIYGTFFAGALVLALVLLLWIRSRVNEIAILLSVGISRMSIILQHIAELVFIGVPSLVLAYVFGRTVSGGIAEMMVEQSAANALQEAGANGMMLGADADTGALTSTIDELAVAVKLSDLAVVGLLLLLVIGLSVLVADIPLMRKKPKDILTQID